MKATRNTLAKTRNTLAKPVHPVLSCECKIVCVAFTSDIPRLLGTLLLLLGIPYMYKYTLCSVHCPAHPNDIISPVVSIVTGLRLLSEVWF